MKKKKRKNWKENTAIRVDGIVNEARRYSKKIMEKLKKLVERYEEKKIS